jgi:hypothetical protein
MKNILYFILALLTFLCSKDDVSEMKKIVVLSEADSKEYPFVLPTELTAVFNITANKEAANNLLLGLNFGGYLSSNQQATTRYFNPVHIRFPSGVWSNWYNLEKEISEYYKTDSYDIGTFQKQVTNDYGKCSLYTGLLVVLRKQANTNLIYASHPNLIP